MNIDAKSVTDLICRATDLLVGDIIDIQWEGKTLKVKTGWAKGEFGIADYKEVDDFGLPIGVPKTLRFCAIGALGACLPNQSPATVAIENLEDYTTDPLLIAAARELLKSLTKAAYTKVFNKTSYLTDDQGRKYMQSYNATTQKYDNVYSDRPIDEVDASLITDLIYHFNDPSTATTVTKTFRATCDRLQADCGDCD